MAKNDRQVFGGVDTHADTHTSVMIDRVGRVIGTRQFGSDPAGCQELVRWVRRHGRVQAVGVEGTGSYGAGLARLLTAQGVRVVEVDRADRQARRRHGKSDPVDAEAAARAVQSGTATGTPKTRNGPVEAIRVLRVARSGAVEARTAALNSLLALARSAVAVPLSGSVGGSRIGVAVHGKTARQLVTYLGQAPAAAKPSPVGASRGRPAGRPLNELVDPALATALSMGRIARRITDLDIEIKDADRDLRALTRHLAPALLARPGVGPEVAAQLLITAGDNPGRLTDHNSFALLSGVAPLPASSGRTQRHRLNRGGDRQANRALHTVVLSRMSHDPKTRAYVERRSAQQMSTKEIMRCLKRYVARELFPLILNALEPDNPTTTDIDDLSSAA